MSNTIDSVEHLSQVYEAFDTIAEDQAELQITVGELLELCGDDTDAKSIVYTEATKDRQLIQQRKTYVLESLFRAAALSSTDMSLAALAYTSNYEDPEKLEQASKRVGHYNQVIERTFQHGAPLNLSLVPPSRTEPTVSGEKVRLHGRTDPATGQTWYNITDPRTVEYVDRQDDPVGVMVYEVLEHTEVDGQTTVVARQPSSGEGTITAIFGEDSRKWRMSDDKKSLELFIPGNSKSLLESGMLEQLNKLVDSNDSATQTAVAATGANIPNIIASFEHPDNVNPVPISNPKRN